MLEGDWEACERILIDIHREYLAKHYYSLMVNKTLLSTSGQLKKLAESVRNFRDNYLAFEALRHLLAVRVRHVVCT